MGLKQKKIIKKRSLWKVNKKIMHIWWRVDELNEVLISMQYGVKIKLKVSSTCYKLNELGWRQLTNWYSWYKMHVD